nr:hypothetical protein [Candidatus Njordarchaeota archaeon]
MRRTVDASFIAIFGALIALSSLIPLSIVVGGSGVFSLTWVIQTLTGVLLGPYVGGGAAIIGGLTGNLIYPSGFGPIAFILPVLAAVQAGLIVWRRWRIAALLLGSLIILWFLVPVGLVAWPMALFHLLGLIIIIALGRRLPVMIRDVEYPRRVFTGWFLTAYCADVSRHMLGNIFSAVILSFPPEVFLLALPFTAIEQTVFAASSALIGVSILLIITSAKLDIPLMRPEGQEGLTDRNKLR